MTRHRYRFLIVLLFFCACHGPFAVPEPGGEFLAVIHVNVIPVHVEGVLRDHTVLIDGERIVEVAPADEVTVPVGARVIDGTGRFLIPGIADMHEHLPRGDEPWESSFDEYFDLQLAAGVTTIRSMRGSAEDIELGETIRSGDREGPRLILGSPGLDKTLVPDPGSARSRVRDYKEAGFDFIKVLGGFTSETFEAIAEEAQLQGLPLAGHLPSVVPLGRALSEPFWSLEHLHGHRVAYQNDPDSFADLARQTAEAGVWVCPTIGFQISWYAQESVDAMTAWPGLRHAYPEAVAQWTREAATRFTSDAEQLQRNTLTVQAIRRCTRALADAGVGLLVSSSGGWFLVPGFSMFVEFRCLTDAGLTPAEILEAATLNAARSVNEEDDWGSVRPGRAADLVLLDANPLESIRNAETVRAVIRRGRYHDREELDRRLGAVGLAGN